MDEDEKREIFRTLPFELNTIIVKLLEPEEKIRFGRVSKFCHGLVANFEDRISKLFWKGLTNSTNGPDVFSFEVQNSTDVYIFGVEVAPRRVRVDPRVLDFPNRQRWTSKIDMDEFLESFRNSSLNAAIFSSESLNRRPPSPPYSFPHNNFVSLATLKKRPKDSQNLIQCWEKRIRGSCFQVAIEFFANLLRYNQESMKHLSIIFDKYVTRFLQNNRQVENWFYPSNLNSLEFVGNSKKYGSFWRTYFIDTVVMYSLALDLDDLSQFKSSELSLTIGSITEEMFKKYLTDWRDNKLHRNLKRLKIRGIPDETNFSLFFENGFAVFVGESKTIQNGCQQMFIIKTSDEVDFELYGAVTFIQHNRQIHRFFEVLKKEKKNE